MSNFSSDKIEINTTPEKVFPFLEDLNNLGLIMPEQVENWKSDRDECSFFIKNLGDLSLKKGKVNFPDQIIFNSLPQSKVNFKLILSLSSLENQNLLAGFEINSEMNSLIEMMAKRPLTNFVNLLAKNLKTQIENR